MFGGTRCIAKSDGTRPRDFQYTGNLSCTLDSKWISADRDSRGMMCVAADDAKLLGLTQKLEGRHSMPKHQAQPASGRTTRSRHHLKALALAAAAAALNAGEQASAASVGIHFRYTYNGAPGATINTSGPQVFAGVPASLWNNM